MTAPLLSRTRLNLFVRLLRSMHLVLLTTPILVLHEHLVIKLGSAPTPMPDRTSRHLISWLSVTTPVITTILIVPVLYQTRTHTSILASRFYIPHFNFTTYNSDFSFRRFGIVYLCDLFGNSPIRGIDSKAGVSNLLKLHTSSSFSCLRGGSVVHEASPLY